MLTNIKVIWNSLIMALQELRINKLRTFLSLLGITIGIFCIIAVSTITDSLETNVRNQVSSLGSNVIYVQKWQWGGGNGPYQWWKFIKRPESKYREFKTLQQTVKGSDAAAFVYNSGNQKVEVGDSYVQGISMIAITQDFSKIQDLGIQEGRYFSPLETSGSSAVTILGYNAWNDLFGSAQAALGKTVALSGKQLQVIGTMKKYGSSLVDAFDYDNSVLVPFFTAREIVDERKGYVDPFIMVKARPGVGMDELSSEIRGEMRAIRRLKPTQEDNFSMNQVSMVSGNLDKVFGTINMAGRVIGIFALIVGAFGIANIMFVTVKERTSLIGLKKAIGAKKNTILLEFLLEAIVLCLIGGLMGIGLVYVGTFVVAGNFSFQVTLSTHNILTGLEYAVFTGIVAGIVPAYF
ncbi:MAG: ABC transporter permease, partial [Chitinophagaceae bacterium]